MDQAVQSPQKAPEKDAKAQLKSQIEQYLAQQPESTLSAHKWLKRFEMAGWGIVVAIFVAAFFLSVMWKNIDPILIPVAWFTFAASGAPALIFLGLDSILLKAFPTSLTLARPARFFTGSAAVWIGIGFIVQGVFLGVIMGAFAYAVGTMNMAMLEPLIRILGGVLGIVMTAVVIYSVLQKLMKTS